MIAKKWKIIKFTFAFRIQQLWLMASSLGCCCCCWKKVWWYDNWSQKRFQLFSTGTWRQRTVSGQTLWKERRSSTSLGARLILICFHFHLVPFIVSYHAGLLQRSKRSGRWFLGFRSPQPPLAHASPTSVIWVYGVRMPGNPEGISILGAVVLSCLKTDS